MTDTPDNDTGLVLRPNLLPEQARKLQEAVEDLRAAQDASQAARTRREYEKGWERFVAWCESTGVDPTPPTPPEAVALFLSNVRKLDGTPPSVSVLAVWRAAIDHRNRAEGHDAPSHHEGVERVWKGLRRSRPNRPTKKAALTAEELVTLLEQTGPDERGARDRAILSIGWVGALRREEVCGLRLGDVVVDTDKSGARALRLDLGATKGDQEGTRGEHVVPELPGSPFDPVTAFVAWRERLRAHVYANRPGPLPAADPVFRRVWRSGRIGDDPLHPSSIARSVVKKLAEGAGLARGIEVFAGHSLRAGGITALSDEGLLAMQQHARHKRADTTVGYYRPAEELREHPMRRALATRQEAVPGEAEDTA